MSAVEIKDLFFTNRFPRGLLLIPVLLYFPLGLCFVVLRFFVGAHIFLIACLLPKTWLIRRVVLRCMCLVMGIVITQDGKDNLKPPVKCMVANNISMLDHLAVELIVPHIMPSVYDLPPALNWLLGYTEMGVKEGRQRLIENATRHCQESNLPVFAHPEGASTNGKKGLLKFSAWPFSLGVSVHPVLINVQRPAILNIKPSVLGGRWWVDTFWFMFVPFTRFHLKFIPSIDKKEEEDASDFTKRVQQSMSAELGVVSTVFTSADKVEHAKRVLFMEPITSRITHIPSSPTTRAPSSQSSLSSQPASPRETRLDSMSQQVKVVLPHVPLHDIKRDLGHTNDVDKTITNILEGRVTFTSEDPTRPAPPPTVVITPKKSSQAAVSFPRSSKDRMKSFQERKQEMIESARQKYMAKHGLS